MKVRYILFLAMICLAGCGGSDESVVEVSDADDGVTDGASGDEIDVLNGDGAGDSGDDEVDEVDEVDDDSNGVGDDNVVSGIALTPSGLDVTPLMIERFTDENVESALEAYIRLIRGDDQVLIFNEFLELEASLDSPESGFELLSVTDLLGSQIYICPDAGQLSKRGVVDDGATDDIYTIENCVVNGDTLNGTVRVQRDSSDVRGFPNALLSVCLLYTSDAADE